MNAENADFIFWFNKISIPLRACFFKSAEISVHLRPDYLLFCYAQSVFILMVDCRL